MSDNVVHIGPRGTEFHGPFIEEWKVSYNGYLVPYLRAFVKQDADWVSLLLDSRFVIDGPSEEIKKWVPFIADCMAVAAGYSCAGKNCTPMNRFTTQIGELP